MIPDKPLALTYQRLSYAGIQAQIQSNFRFLISSTSSTSLAYNCGDREHSQRRGHSGNLE